MWSDEEIRRCYRAAKHPKQQIGILAELTLKSQEEIERICGVEKKDKSVETVSQKLYERLDELEAKMQPLKAQLKPFEEEYERTAIAIEVVGKVGL